MNMLTCEACGKTNGGKGEVGTSWICGDCQVGNDHPGQPDNSDDDSDQGGSAAPRN